jgi:hypothetical protein
MTSTHSFAGTHAISWGTALVEPMPSDWCTERRGLDPGEYRIEWVVVDETDGAITLEVKSASYLQCCPQLESNVISFPITQRSKQER